MPSVSTASSLCRLARRAFVVTRRKRHRQAKVCGGPRMVSLAHSDRSVQEAHPSQSVRHVASRGDRARRVSFANGRIARFVLPVAAAAFLASALAALAGGPRIIGLLLLAGSAIAAGVTVLSARRARLVPDDVVAELDRAADLGGSLRSAHWFAGDPGVQPVSGDVWITFHLEDAVTARRTRGLGAGVPVATGTLSVGDRPCVRAWDARCARVAAVSSARAGTPHR